MAVKTNVVKERARVAPEIQPSGAKEVANLADQQAKQMADRAANEVVELQKLKDIGEQLKAALSIGDIDQAKILQANFDSARATLATNTKDLAEVMLAISTQYDNIGISIQSLKEMNDAEKAVIAGPEKVVAQLTMDLEAAEGELKTIENAPQGLFGRVFGSKQDDIDEAKRKIAGIKSRITAAEEALKSATTIARQMQRERLIDASLEESLQRLVAVTDQAIQIATSRIGIIEEDLSVVRAGLIDTVADIEKLTVDLQGHDQELEQMDGNIRTLTEQQREHTQGTPEYATLQTQLTAANTAREIKVADRTKTFMLLQEQERFKEQYQIHQTVQQQSLEFHRAWIATLELGNQHRTKLFKSQIGAMQAMGDQEAMSTIDAAATAVDLRNTAAMAGMAQAQRKAIVERAERMPGELAMLRGITKADVQGQVEFERRMAGVAALFHKNYGDESDYATVAEQLRVPATADMTGPSA